ncbi:hypothetical protein HMPREF3033_00947 [Veillonellaceae bacterium DNF00751]|nr:hypothetical protein HMPREF3033_00947 [Veillonellaceae bacterium DNF00751]
MCISFRLFIVVYPPHRKFPFFYAYGTEKAIKKALIKSAVKLKN